MWYVYYFLWYRIHKFMILKKQIVKIFTRARFPRDFSASRCINGYLSVLLVLKGKTPRQVHGWWAATLTWSPQPLTRTITYWTTGSWAVFAVLLQTWSSTTSTSRGTTVCFAPLPGNVPAVLHALLPHLGIVRPLPAAHWLCSKIGDGNASTSSSSGQWWKATSMWFPRLGTP